MNKKSIFAAMFTFGIIALSLLFFAGSVGAAPSEDWNRTFRGMGFCIIESVQQTADGGYVLAGYRTGREDRGGAWLIKVDAEGNELWNRTFGEWNRTFGGRGEWANSVQQTKDGSYIIAGTTFLRAVGSYVWLKKVGEGQNASAKTPAASPTETLIATPTQTFRAVSNETQTVSSAEKIAGFEIILSISMLHGIGRHDSRLRFL